MDADPDPVLEAIEILRAAGVTATPEGDDFERWRVGDLVYDDVGLVRLAERFFKASEA